MYKAIIFDFFGVIHADPYQIWLNAHGLKREGEFAETSNLADKNLITWQEFFERLSSLSGQPIPSIKEVFYQEKQIDGAIIDLIKKLKASYKLGLLSNASGAYLRPILQETGIDDLFEADIISAEVGIIKPDPEIFKLAVEKLDVEPGQTIFIDDNSYNTEAAEALGISPILYRDLATLKEELSRLGINFS